MIDVTGGLAQQVSKLPVEMQPVIMALMDRIDKLESQTALDLNAIADKVIAALVPQVQALTQTVNEVSDEALTSIRQIMLRGVTIQLGVDPNKV